MSKYRIETITDLKTLTGYAMKMAKTQQIVAITRNGGIIMLLCDVAQDEVDTVLFSLNHKDTPI